MCRTMERGGLMIRREEDMIELLGRKADGHHIPVVRISVYVHFNLGLSPRDS